MLKELLQVAIFFLPILTVFFIISRTGKDLSDRERIEDYKNNKAYELKVGAHMGDLSLTYPFVKFTFNIDSIFIKAQYSTIEIKKSDVTALRLIRGLTMKGLKIEHNRSDIPPKIVIWSRYNKSIYDFLNSHI